MQKLTFKDFINSDLKFIEIEQQVYFKEINKYGITVVKVNSSKQAREFAILQKVYLAEQLMEKDLIIQHLIGNTTYNCGDDAKQFFPLSIKGSYTDNFNTFDHFFHYFYTVDDEGFIKVVEYPYRGNYNDIQLLEFLKFMSKILSVEEMSDLRHITPDILEKSSYNLIYLQEWLEYELKK